MKPKGQALVEFALVFPVLLFTILGGIEAGFLLVTKAHQDRVTSVIAEWAATHPGESWNSVANRELPGCTVTVSPSSSGLVEAGSRCQYHAKVLVGLPLFDIPISSREMAVELQPAEPSETPVASPS